MSDLTFKVAASDLSDAVKKIVDKYADCEISIVQLINECAPIEIADYDAVTNTLFISSPQFQKDVYD